MGGGPLEDQSRFLKLVLFLVLFTYNRYWRVQHLCYLFSFEHFLSNKWLDGPLNEKSRKEKIVMNKWRGLRYVDCLCVCVWCKSELSVSRRKTAFEDSYSQATRDILRRFSKNVFLWKCVLISDFQDKWMDLPNVMKLFFIYNERKYFTSYYKNERVFIPLETFRFRSILFMLVLYSSLFNVRRYCRFKVNFEWKKDWICEDVRLLTAKRVWQKKYL